MKLKEEKNNKVSDGWEIRIAETVDQIEEIRSVWEKMQNTEEFPSINADIDHYLSVLKTMNKNVQPYVITLAKEGVPEAMIIARIQMHEIKIMLGYKSLLSPKLKCLTVVYGGILGELKSDVCSFLISALIKQLKSRKVSMVYFNRLRTDSQMFNLSRKMPVFLCRDYIPEVDLHWQTIALDNKEPFSKTLSRNERRNIRRHTKQLEEKALNQVILKSFHGLETLEEFISIASEISSVTYQKTLTGGFTDSNFVRSLLEQAAKKNWLRAYILYAGSEPIAFEVGVVYKSTYFAEYRGYHPEWSCGSPGSILLLKVLEEFSRDPDIETYDYGFGDAPYKQRYGQNHWFEAPIHIFAPGLYPISVNLMRTLVIALNVSIKYILSKSGLINRIKKMWRKNLEQKALEKSTKSKVA